jgi:hypothetical protein
MDDTAIVERGELHKRFPKRKVRNAGSTWQRLKPRRRTPREWMVAIDRVTLHVREGEVFPGVFFTWTH